jgi:hypothetical protein
MSVPQLRRLVAGSSQRKPGLAPRSVHAICYGRISVLTQFSSTCFLISFTTYGRIPRTSNQLVARALPLPYTGQHNTEAKTNIPAPSGIRTCSPVHERSRPAPQRPFERFHVKFVVGKAEVVQIPLPRVLRFPRHYHSTFATYSIMYHLEDEQRARRGPVPLTHSQAIASQ